MLNNLLQNKTNKLLIY